MSQDSLNRSGIQASNPALFDTIKELVDKVTKLDKSASTAGIVFDPNLLGPLGSFLQSTGTDLLWQPEFTTILRRDIGTINNYNPNVAGNAIITLENPGLLIINGFFVGYPGQILVFKSASVSTVGFGNFTGGAKDTKLVNQVLGNTLLGAGGYIIYQYMANPIFGGENAWIMIGHSQGASIAINPVLDGTGAMTWTPTATPLYFTLDGDKLLLSFYGIAGTIGGVPTSEARFTMPYTSANYIANQLGPVLYTNAGGADTWGFAQTTAGDNHVSIFQNSVAPWVAGNLSIFGQLTYIVS